MSDVIEATEVSDLVWGARLQDQDFESKAAGTFPHARLIDQRFRIIGINQHGDELGTGNKLVQ